VERRQLDNLLAPYNPWWVSATGWEQDLDLPDYERPVVRDVLADLKELPQVVSVTGPRRVGKSTAVRHVIGRLIRDQSVNPRRILYFSFDDPEIAGSQENQRAIFDLLVDRMKPKSGTAYLFLDEVQRLPRWELFVKKHYDLKTPVRLMVSGSASSLIFRKSQESLLGRIKDTYRVGGENVSAQDVENFYMQHPKVLRACAIGVPDERLIEAGMVFIDLKKGETATEKEMIDYAKGRIAPFKVPRHVKFTHDFPMTGSGKIQKFILKENAVKDLGLEES